jgi:ribose transport system permease protein
MTTPTRVPARALARLPGAVPRFDTTIVPPVLMLVALLVIYQAVEPGGFSSSQIGVTSMEILPLALVALGQCVVVLGSGIDLSVGGVMSVGSALAARHFGGGPLSITAWALVIALIGVACGCLNGLLVTRLRLQPFLVTLATWSILDGVALIILPTQGLGSVAAGYGNLAFTAPGGIPFAVWVLAVVLLAWLWFRGTRAARGIYALGSDRGNAFVSGVSVTRTTVLAFGISGLTAALAALAYTVQTASGDPSAGAPFILTSVTAVVIGGTRLSGGRGGFGGTLIGAILLILIGDVIFAVGLPTEWTQFFQGLLLVIAILASSVGEAVARRRAATS